MGKVTGFMEYERLEEPHEAPQARKVLSIGSRCSKASPIAELTMKRPTTKDSSPNAVRFK